MCAAACLFGGAQNALAAESSGTTEVTLIYDPAWERVEQSASTTDRGSLAQTGDSALWTVPLFLSVGMLALGCALRGEDEHAG